MAWTQADIDKLKAMMVTGVGSVTFADGRQVQYRSMAELRDALELAQAEVSASANGSAVSYCSFSKD